MSDSIARPVRTTTRAGWQTFMDLLKNRQAFTTSGALHGGPVANRPLGWSGQLPADWRNLLDTGADYVVYSYSTPIAWHRPTDDLWIIPDERYSVTTSRHQSLIGTAVSQLHSAPCACGIPNKANWHVGITYDFGDETGYTDVYSCDEHFPGYPDGSMSDAEAKSLLRWDGSHMADVLEHKATHLR